MCFKQNISTARKSNRDIRVVSLKGDAVNIVELNGFYVTEGVKDVTLWEGGNISFDAEEFQAEITDPVGSMPSSSDRTNGNNQNPFLLTMFYAQRHHTYL